MKKPPGAESVLMVYDLRERLVATQEGVQCAKSLKEWLFSKYNELGQLLSKKLHVASGAGLQKMDYTYK